MTTETQGLDLRKYAFPKVTGADVAFPTANTDPALLKEAHRRGYDMNSRKPGSKMFRTLFYSGGKVNFRDDLPPEFKTAAWGYLRSLIGSWAPKHEDKEAVCSMLLDELATSVEEVKKEAA